MQFQLICIEKEKKIFLTKKNFFSTFFWKKFCHFTLKISSTRQQILMAKMTSIKKNAQKIFFHIPNSLFPKVDHFWNKTFFLKILRFSDVYPTPLWQQNYWKPFFFPSKTPQMLPKNDPLPLKIFFSESRPNFGEKIFLNFLSIFSAFAHL